MGTVTSIDLDQSRARVAFTVDKDIRLGDRTEAAIKTKGLLGTKLLEITSRGDGQLDGLIPLERTTSPYQLPDALGDLASTISGLNTDQLSEFLRVLSATFADPRRSCASRSTASPGSPRPSTSGTHSCATCSANADKATTVLAQRSDQIVGLVNNSNALLAELRTQSAALDQISGSISTLSEQLLGFIMDNRAILKPSLDKLNGVLTMIDNRKERLQKSLHLLQQYSMSLGESVSSGPFFKTYVANLLPGQFVQPFVDAAFSRSGSGPQRAAAVGAHRSACRPAGNAGASDAYPRTGQAANRA